MHVTRGLVAFALIVFGGPVALAGDILVWHDANGGVHYTTSLEGVPPDRREEAKTFVRERPRAAPEPAPPEETPAVEAAVATEAETLEDRIVRAFAAGVEAGREQAEEPSVEIVPTNVVQSTEVLVEAPESEAILVGGFPGRGRPGEPIPEEEEPEDTGFVVGPAGPPPLGAAGPPPVD